MSAAAVRRTADDAGDLLSIGDVLGRLQPEFPDVTISKIRFLEAEGLVEPARTSSGYRKFTHADVERLRYVLAMQRDHYLPLKVIREHLDAIDRGLEPPALAAGAPRVPRPLVRRPAPATTPGRPPSCACPGPSCSRGLASPTRCSTRWRRTGSSSRGTGTTTPTPWPWPPPWPPWRRSASSPGTCGRSGSPPTARSALVQQVVGPAGRGRSSQAQERADESVRELASLAVRLHAALVRRGLGAHPAR